MIALLLWALGGLLTCRYAYKLSGVNALFLNFLIVLLWPVLAPQMMIASRKDRWKKSQPSA